MEAIADSVMQPDPDDASLLAAWQGGERAAFDLLVQRYQPLVEALCQSQLRGGDLNEAVQQVFLMLMKRTRLEAPSGEVGTTGSMVDIARLFPWFRSFAASARTYESRSEVDQLGRWPRMSPPMGADKPNEPMTNFFRPPNPAIGDLSPGDFFGSYRIIEKIGKGGMGVVYRAEELELGRAVALKVMLPEMLSDAEAHGRFLREAKAASKVMHPHVVALFQVGEINGSLFMAFEYLSGGDLNALIRREGHLEEKLALRLAIDCTAGLTAIHKAGLIHRDIKPGNIFLNESGQAKLGDLGLARAAGGDDLMTIQGRGLGTPAYMAPEQAKGRTDIDIRADIHALGATLYTMLTGQPPFKGPTSWVTVQNLMSKEVPDPREVVPEISGGTVGIIRKTMAKDRSRRYRHPDELLSDLRAVLAGRPPAAGVVLFNLKVGPNTATAVPPPPPMAPETPMPQITRSSGRQSPVMPRPTPRPEQRPTPRPDVASGDRRTPRLPSSDDRRNQFPGAGNTARAEGASPPQSGSSHTPRPSLRTPPPEATPPLPSPVAKPVSRVPIGPISNPPLVDDAAEIDTASFLDKTPPLKTTADRIRTPLALKPAAIPPRPPTASPPPRPPTASPPPRPPTASPPPPALPSQAAPLRPVERPRQAKSLATSDQTQVPLRQPRKRWLTLGVAMLVVAGFAAGGWYWQHDQHRRAIASLQGSLADLERLDPVTLAQVQRLRPTVDRLAELTGPTDTMVVAARRRLDAVEPEVRSLQGRLAGVTEAASIDAAAWREVRISYYRLQKILGPDHPQILPLIPKVDPFIQEEARLRRDLSALDLVQTPPATAATDLARLTTLAGGADGDCLRWRRKLEQLAELRQRLAGLDTDRAPPEDSEATLKTWIGLVGPNDPDSSRWYGRLHRVETLRVQLALLDQARPIPAQTGAALDDLARQVGEDDPLVRQGRTKLVAVARLVEELKAIDHTTTETPALRKAVIALARLVSTDDPVVRLRLAQLASLARPAWADTDGHDAQGRWAELRLRGTGLRLRWIRPGSFTMGSPANDPDRQADERPRPVVLTKAFWLSECVIDRKFWATVMGGSDDSPADQPAIRISYAQALDFLDRLNRERPGLDARLPTEAEWEYASRAGSPGPRPADLPNPGARRPSGPAALRSRPANAWGLHGMVGQLWEWCFDAYGAWTDDPATDPCLTEGGLKVLRGGSWRSLPAQCRYAERDAARPDFASPATGLRLLIPAAPVGPLEAP